MSGFRAYNQKLWIQSANRIKRTPFNWRKISGMQGSQASRDLNMQKIWFRPTIGWKLECDREKLSREDASEIFSMRLEDLGFIDYVIYLAIILVLLIVGPFLLFCCKSRDVQNNPCLWLFGMSPVTTRLLFAGCLFTIFELNEIERMQCHDNVDKVDLFEKTNNCGDIYTHMNTKQVTE